LHYLGHAAHTLGCDVVSTQRRNDDPTISGPVRRTRPRPEGRLPATSTYNELLARVRAEGLLERRRGFYITVF
jgi:hypothetical protein